MRGHVYVEVGDFGGAITLSLTNPLSKCEIEEIDEAMSEALTRLGFERVLHRSELNQSVGVQKPNDE